MTTKDAIDPTSHWFWAFALGHLLVWTAVPILTQDNAPLDAAEMLAWGHEWEWGYHKHPPLPAWAAEAFAMTFGATVWPTYLLSQVCIVGCFWAAWRMGREVLSPAQALAGVILLESSIYYNFTTPEFNNNVMAKVCWALFAWLLYCGMTRDRIAYWAAAGVFLAAALLSKYDAALLLISVLCFSIVSPRARACWRRPGPYVLTVVAFALFAPHLWWLVEHDFPTVRYVLSRSSAASSWLSHVRFPAKFLGAQLGSAGLVLLVATIALGWRWRIRPVAADAQFHRVFLSFVVLGPLAIALLFSAATGAHIRSMWGASMFTYLGVLLLSWFEARPEPLFLRRAMATSLAVSLMLAIALAGRNLFGSRLQNEATRGDFPGEELAEYVDQLWDARETAPLKYIGGDPITSASVSVYHPDRPSVFLDLDRTFSPWADEQDWWRDGGVVVWDVDVAGDGYDEYVQSVFPEAEFLPPLGFTYERAPRLRPQRFGIAIVAPHGDQPRVAERPPLARDPKSPLPQVPSRRER